MVHCMNIQRTAYFFIIFIFLLKKSEDLPQGLLECYLFKIALKNIYWSDTSHLFRRRPYTIFFTKQITILTCFICIYLSIKSISDSEKNILQKCNICRDCNKNRFKVLPWSFLWEKRASETWSKLLSSKINLRQIITLFKL